MLLIILCLIGFPILVPMGLSFLFEGLFEYIGTFSILFMGIGIALIVLGLILGIVGIFAISSSSPAGLNFSKFFGNTLLILLAIPIIIQIFLVMFLPLVFSAWIIIIPAAVILGIYTILGQKGMIGLVRIRKIRRIQFRF